MSAERFCSLPASHVGPCQPDVFDQWMAGPTLAQRQACLLAEMLRDADRRWWRPKRTPLVYLRMASLMIERLAAVTEGQEDQQ